MKKQYLNFGIILTIISISLLYSCNEEKNIKYFNMNFELNEPISDLKENDPLPSYLKVLVNYIDTNCTNDLFVPIVTFKRKDLKQPNTYNLKPPLTWINNFRNSRDMLPAEYLKEDYDKLIGDLITPKILVEPKGAIQNTITAIKNKNNVFILNINASSLDSLAILKEKIGKRLCEGKGKGNLIIDIKVVNIMQEVVRIPSDKLIVDSISGRTHEIKLLISKADILSKKKEYTDALKYYNEVIKIDPNNQYVLNRIKDVNGKIRITIEIGGGQIPPSPSPSTSTGKTIHFPNGDIYVGDVLNNLPNGLGTKTFKNNCQISESDIKKTLAEAGDYLVGVWKNGEPQVCKLFNSSGKYKLTISAGSE